MHLDKIYLFFTISLSFIFNIASSQYCTPIVSAPNSPPSYDSIGITNVTLLNLNNSSEAKQGYEDFTFGLAIPVLTKGQSYTLNITPGDSAQFFYTYIDYNQDQIFDGLTASSPGLTELHFGCPGIFVACGIENVPYSTNFQVPINAVGSGNTRMRIQSNENSILFYQGADTCADLITGDVEEYTVFLKDTFYLSQSQPHPSCILQSQTVDQLIMQVKIQSTDSGNIFNATEFEFTTSGSTNPLNDILSAKLYYTIDSSSPCLVPSEATLVGSALNPNGTFTITANQPLISNAKENYFWLAYDINPAASLGNRIDAFCTNVKIEGTSYPIDLEDSTGARYVDNPTNYNRKEANNWYLGQFAIDFNCQTPHLKRDANPDTKTSSSEPGATISDPNGNLLFYCEERKIYDKCHQPMPGGLSFYAQSAKQGIAILPFYEKGIYIIFNTRQSGKLEYTTIDMTLRGGLGDVIPGKLQELALDTATPEAMSVVMHCDKDKYWVMSAKAGTNNHYAFLVNETGIINTVVTNIGPNTYPLSFAGFAFMHFSPDGRYFVNKYQGNQARLFEFDNSTGILSNPLNLADNSATSFSFSPDNSKLYALLGNNQIYQYDLCAVNPLTTRTLVGTLTNYTVNSAYIQNTPNGKTYLMPMAVTTEYIAAINRPNELGLACDFQNQSLYLKDSLNFTRRNHNVWVETFFNESIFTDTIIGFSFDTVCFNTPTTFTDNSKPLLGCSPYIRTYSWNFGDPSSGINNVSSNQNPTHTFTSIDTFNVMLAYAEGCEKDTIYQQVIVYPPPLITSTLNDTSICLGDSISLYVLAENFSNDSIQYNWSPNININNLNISNPIVWSIDTQNYQIVINDSCGADTTSITINIVPPPVGSAGLDSSVCIGSIIQLYAQGGSLYQWFPTSNLNSNTIPNPLATIFDSIQYGVSISNGVCPPDTSYINLAIYPQTIIKARPDTSILYGSSVQLLANNGVNYQWTPSNTLSCFDCPNPIAIPIDLQTKYFVSITDSFGCTIKDSVLINLLINTDVFTPTAFSPNGDNKNDIFIVRADGVSKYKLLIADRWGKIIFETNDIMNGWNGLSKNEKALNTGVYVYFIEITFLDGSLIKQKGNITLVK